MSVPVNAEDIILELSTKSTTTALIEENLCQHGHQSNFPKEECTTRLIPICDKVKKQLTRWVKEHLQQQMVTTAIKRDFHVLSGKSISSWNDLIESWRDLTLWVDPTKQQASAMACVLCGCHNHKSHWNEDIEKEFLN